MRKNIRWIALASAVAAFAAADAQPRQREAGADPQQRPMHQQAAPQQMTAEEQADRETKRMTQELGLNEQQVKKVRKINLRRARMMRQDAYVADRAQKHEERAAAQGRDERPDMGGPEGPGRRPGMGGPGGPGGRPGMGGPGGMMNNNGQLTLFQIEKILTKCDTDMKKTLTPEQYVKWRQMQQHGPGPRSDAAPRSEHRSRPGDGADNR